MGAIDPEHVVCCISPVNNGQVFTALSAAQKSVGFRHWDLRLANIMEHRLTKDDNPLNSPTASDLNDVAAGTSSAI